MYYVMYVIFVLLADLDVRIFLLTKFWVHIPVVSPRLTVNDVDQQDEELPREVSAIHTTR